VVAGGNRSAAATRLDNPSLSPFTLAVGSSDTKGTLSHADDQLSTFTSAFTGSATTPGRRMDLTAPGEGILSLRDPGSHLDATYPAARIGERLFRGSGSSQAAAVVSGAAALVLQKYPTLTPLSIKRTLTVTATALTDTATNTAFKQLNVGKALAQATTMTAALAESTGTALVEKSRGSIHLVSGNTTLTGEKSPWGTFSASSWATATKNNTAWNGGVWMGKTLTGGGWTGTSWASRTWAPVTWSGTDWGGKAWVDAAWSGRYWSGRYWSGQAFSGRYWSSSEWAAKSWQ
jgi:serine protease AprX